MRFALLAYLSLSAVTAQDAGAYHVELTFSYHPLRPRGNVQLDETTVDFESDLGLGERKPNWIGRLVAKPARRHHFVIEGAPYRFRGENTVNRSFVFQGRTYSVQDTVRSRAELDYVFGGYQFDLVSRERGYIGILGGAVHGDASVSATSLNTGLSAVASVSGTIPAAGVDFRAYLLPGRTLLYADGELKGMSFGDRGRYVQFAGSVGVALGRNVGLLAGYTVTDAEVRNSDRIQIRFEGPIFSVQFRDR